MSEQTTDEKLARAIAALREIADAEPMPFGGIPTDMAEALEVSGFGHRSVMESAFQSRARVCLFAIDQSYTAGSNAPNGIVMSGDGTMRTIADNHDPRECKCAACVKLVGE